MRRLAAVGIMVGAVLLALVVVYRPVFAGSPLAQGEIVALTVTPPVTQDCIRDPSEVPSLDDVPIQQRPVFCRDDEAVAISVGDGRSIALVASVTPNARVMRRLVGGLAFQPISASALRVGQTVVVWGDGLDESDPPQTDATVVEVR